MVEAALMATVGVGGGVLLAAVLVGLISLVDKYAQDRYKVWVTVAGALGLIWLLVFVVVLYGEGQR